MKKIWDFFSKWGVTMLLALICATMWFALACCICALTVNVFMGVIGMIGSALSITVVSTWLYFEIEDRNDTTN